MKVSGMYRRIALVEFDFNDFPTGVFTPVLILPNGAQMLSGTFNVTTPSNAASTDTLALGISGTAGRNMAATTAKTAASTAFTATTTVSGETLGVTRTLGGAAGTAGKGYYEIEYCYPGGCDFIVGDLPSGKDLNNSVSLT
jgi:hypothetical protein